MYVTETSLHMHGIATVYEHSIRSSIWLETTRRQETCLHSRQFEIQQAKRQSLLRSARQQSINRKQRVRVERIGREITQSIGQRTAILEKATNHSPSRKGVSLSHRSYSYHLSWQLLRLISLHGNAQGKTANWRSVYGTLLLTALTTVFWRQVDLS